MYTDFNKFNKSQRSDFINGLWSINQILKNVFLSIYLSPDGKIVSDKLNKLDSGIHSGYCNLQDYLIVPVDSCLRIDCNKIYTIIKDYKSLLEGILYENDSVYFVIKDVGNAIIGKITKPVEVKTDGYNGIDYKDTYSWFTEADIETLVDKKILEKNVEGYKMILSHKLFPNIKKMANSEINIRDYNDGCFIGNFNLSYTASNSSGKKIYSNIVISHKYKFIKI